MTRRAALFSEITGCADDAATEVMLPEPVHHDARRQWIPRISDVLREFQASAAMGERLCTAEHGEEMTRFRVAFRERIPAQEDARRGRQGPVHEDGRMRRGVRSPDEETVHVRLRLPQRGD